MKWFQKFTRGEKIFIIAALVVPLIGLMGSLSKGNSTPVDILQVNHEQFMDKPEGAVFYMSGACTDTETNTKGLCAVFYNVAENGPLYWIIFSVDGERMYVKEVGRDGSTKVVWVSSHWKGESI